MPSGALFGNGVDSVTTPSVVIEAIVFPVNEVKRRLSPAPGRIKEGVCGTGKVVITPAVVTLEIVGVNELAIQILPSGPAAMDPGESTPVNSVITPLGVIFANLPDSVNQILPSAPRVMSPGNEFGVGVLNSVKIPVERL